MKNFLRRVAANIICRLPKGLLLGREFFDLYERHGFHVTHVHFYQPLPDTRDFKDSDFTEKSKMVGLVTDTASFQETLNSDAFAEHHQDCLTVAARYGDAGKMDISFGGLDASVLYHIIRSHKPKRLIEVGSGFSTILSAEAGLQNEADGHPLDILAIEPYPRADLLESKPANVTILEKKVQDVDFDTFEALEAGDVLFIDSSHVVTFGSDVVYEVNEILPRLKPGVIVHFHDIPMPYNYSREWVKEEKVFWNEQYILQAFLQFNDSFEILWSAGIARAEFPQDVQTHFPDFDPAKQMAGSLWLRRTK